MKKHTKIVATISDRRCSVSFLKQLHDNGMDVVRINTAHQTPETARKVVANVKKVSNYIPILIDTKGPEIRTTKMDKAIEVSAGDKLLVKGGASKASSSDCLYLSYDSIVEDVPVGASLLIDDGEVLMIVKQKKDNALLCEIQNDGEIKGRKSVNLPGVTLTLPSLSEKDHEFIEFAIENKLDFIAHSFVRNKEDVLAVQKLLGKHTDRIKIIAKIENQAGVDNIDEILDHAYGVMIARGDLGIEIPMEKIPVVQRYLIRKCIERKKPVIVATQMLHSMIKNPRPTRAEVSDVAKAIYRGTDAIMLSGETAYGDYPVEAVQVMNKVAMEIEEDKEVRTDRNVISSKNQIGVWLAEAAFNATLQLPIKAIILDSLSGRTARYMSAFRVRPLVHAIAYRKRVVRQLALSYGIYADYLPKRQSTEEFLNDALHLLLEKTQLQKEDMVVIIGGSFGARHGASFINISTVHNLMNMGKKHKNIIQPSLPESTEETTANPDEESS